MIPVDGSGFLAGALSPDEWERLWEEILAAIGERTGISRKDIEAILAAETEFWATRPRMLNTALFGDDDPEGVERGWKKL